MSFFEKLFKWIRRLCPNVAPESQNPVTASKQFESRFTRISTAILGHEQGQTVVITAPWHFSIVEIPESMPRELPVVTLNCDEMNEEEFRHYSPGNPSFILPVVTKWSNDGVLVETTFGSEAVLKIKKLFDPTNLNSEDSGGS